MLIKCLQRQYFFIYDTTFVTDMSPLTESPAYMNFWSKQRFMHSSAEWSVWGSGHQKRTLSSGSSLKQPTCSSVNVTILLATGFRLKGACNQHKQPTLFADCFKGTGLELGVPRPEFEPGLVLKRTREY